MAAEKVVVLGYGKCQAFNSFPEMDTDEQEPENVQDNSAVKCPASAILYDQEDLSNDIPRPLADTVKTSTQAAANYFTNQENNYTPSLPGAKYSLSKRIRCICKCWTELEGLPSDDYLKRYIHALFCNTIRLTLSKEWSNATSWDCENLRNALFHMNSRACQALAVLLPSPWGGEPILKVIHGSFVPNALDDAYESTREEHRNACAHACTDACTKEPRNVPRTRVELLCYAGLKHEALRLCLYYHNCPVLSEDSFYGLTAFHLLYVAGSIKHLINEVDSLTCHDGFHLIQLVLLEHNNVHPLAECLLQILLVRDLVGPSPYCCTLALMEMWCSLHVKQGTSLEDVEQEVQKLGALATKSAHLYLLVDVLYKQYGRRLLPLYLNLYVHALTIDFNNLEYARQVDCRVAIAELETHMSGIYTKLASLLVAEEDQGLARECELTAFSLEPTIERLTKLQIYALSYPMKWSYHHVVRLVPCSGECHCSEKGLCRRDPAVPPWFMTHVPSGILDSNLKGVSRQLLQDLCILVEGPRCRWLTWNMPWRNLHEICMHYLTTAREFRACTDDRRVGIEARLKRLGPFDSSSIPVYRKGHTTSLNKDLQECMVGQNERKSTTENCNEIGTSTVQGEMQINVSGTSEMKTEPSEITKNALNGKNDVPEIGESLVPVMNITASSTDFNPKQNVNISAGCAMNIHDSLDSCQYECRTDKIEKVELAVTLEDYLQRHLLQENCGIRDLKTVQMTQDVQQNAAHLAKKPFKQTQAHLNVIKECNTLTESVMPLVSEKCGQHEFSSSLSPLRPEHCSPIISQSTNATAIVLHSSNKELSNDATIGAVRPFSIDAKLALAQTVNEPVPGLISGPQCTNEAVTNKNRCMEALRSFLNPGCLQSPVCTNIELSVKQAPPAEKLPSVTQLTRECSLADTLDVRIGYPSEPKKGGSPPPINLESLIAETLHYSPKKSYETVLASEAPSSAAAHILHPQPSPSVPSIITMASTVLHTECTSVTSTAGGLPAMAVLQCSAPLLDHLYGKNMMQPFFAESPPVTNPSVQSVAHDYAAQSSTPIRTMTSSGISQNMSITLAQQQQTSYAKPTNGATSSLPVSTTSSGMNSHQVIITKPSGNVAIGSQNVVGCAGTGANVSKMDNVPHIGFKHVPLSTGTHPQIVSECMAYPGNSSFTPVHLTPGIQSVYTIASQTQGILSSSVLGIAAQGNISSKSNSLQTFLKADAVPVPDQVGQAALQPSSKTSVTLAPQPVQAYILQPKINRMKKTLQLTPVDLVQVQQAAKVTGTSQPDISGEASVVFNISKKAITCTPSAFNSSTSSGHNAFAASPSQAYANTSNAKSFGGQQTQVTRVQCPQARAPISQLGVFSNTCRPQILCNSRPNHTPISSLQIQTPNLIPVRPLEIQQSLSSQNAIVSKQSGPSFQQCNNQSKSQTSVCTSPQSITATSTLLSPYTQSTSSSPESNIIAVQPSLTSPLKSRLHLYAAQSRLQTRKPFNKPKTDGKPRWTTSYSPHGKMCHHKNGQEKESSNSRGNENANLPKLNLNASVATSSSSVNIPAAGSRCSVFKMGGAALSCTRITQPIATPNLTTSYSKPVCAVSSNADTTLNKTSVSDGDAVPVTMLVSSEFANSLCAKRISTTTERTAIRPPSLANGAGSGKVSVAMVMPPDLTNCSGISRASSVGYQAVVLPTTLTTHADIDTFSVMLAPSNVNDSSLNTASAATDHTVIESSCLASNSSSSTTSTPVIANLHNKMSSGMDTSLSCTTASSTWFNNSNSCPITTSCLVNATKSNTQSAVTIPNTTSSSSIGVVSAGATRISTPVQSKFCAGGASVAATNLASSSDGRMVRQSCLVNIPCNGAVSATNVPSPSFTTSSNIRMVSDGISRTPNAISCPIGSVLSAALTSHPTVVLNKLDLATRNIPVVKKCISPVILSRTLGKSMTISKLAEAQTQSSTATASKPNLIRPAILGKLPSDSKSLSQSLKCPLGQSSTQDVSRRKDLGSMQPLPKENPLVRSAGFCTSTTNLKCGPSVNALVSLSKTHLEVSMERRVVKQNSLSASSPLKHAIDSPPSFCQSHYSLLAKVHDEPQKCLCPICDKVLMRKSLRMHMINIHKDSRNVEFAENKVMPGSRQELANNLSTDAKEIASLSQMEVVMGSCIADVQEHTPLMVKEVTIPCESATTAKCMSDLQVKNVWFKHDQGMPGVDSKSASDTSIREQSTDSKYSNDDKSTDSTSSDLVSSFLGHIHSSPKSQNDVGIDDNEGSPKKEHLLATTSSDTGDNYVTRGRVSSRNIKPPQKRSCPCCENTSPNSSAKKCRDEKITRSATSPRKSTNSKIPRKTRSSGRNDKSQ